MLAGPSQDFCGTLGTIQMRWDSDTNCAKSGNIGPLQRAHLKTPACIVDNCEQALMQETGPWGSLVKPNVSFLTLQFTRSVINFKKNRGDCSGVEEMAIMSFLVRDTCMWDGVYLHVIHSKTDWRILQGAANVAEPGAWNPPYFQWGMCNKTEADIYLNNRAIQVKSTVTDRRNPRVNIGEHEYQHVAFFMITVQKCDGTFSSLLLIPRDDLAQNDSYYHDVVQDGVSKRVTKSHWRSDLLAADYPNCVYDPTDGASMAALRAALA